MLRWTSIRPQNDLQTVLEAAIAADNDKNYELALGLYMNGIEKMIVLARMAKDDEQRERWYSKINGYITRAETLKEALDSRSMKNPRTSNVDVNPSGRSQSQSNLSRFTRNHTEFAHMILDEVLDQSPGVSWSDIAGLEVAKQILQVVIIVFEYEAVIMPTLRPDLFTGLRSPPRGVLLFGPPGTGKTLLAKAVATESKATFFNISASSLTSKWVGEGEKLVRTLFAVARELQPAVIFMDEMDALLSARSTSETDAGRRIKNQFFTELDGAASRQEDRILVMGATNLPQELDEAIIRRLEKRIYVPLPDASSREALIKHLLGSQKYSISSKEMKAIVKLTEGYSGSDLKAVCKDAALGPIRELGSQIIKVKSEDIRGINAADFRVALTRVRLSVSQETIQSLVAWNEQYGVSAVE